jgi:hypothetical protein
LEIGAIEVNNEAELARLGASAATPLSPDPPIGIL